MSLFNWFSGKSSPGKDPSGKAPPDHDGSGLPRDDRSRPVAGARGKGGLPMPLKSAAHPAERSGEQKSHRHAKRELLYTAVRDAMLRAGVLSASYKFKVLSLDPRGDQFMVMMDLAQEFGGQTERLAEIEVMIEQGAKSRYNIRVTAVYWRLNELVSMARPKSGGHGGSRVPNRPDFERTRAEPTTASPVSAVAALNPSASLYEPIQADEVAAFKQALAAASAQGAAAPEKGVTTRSGPRSYTLLTGFEDTERPDAPASAPALSTTQYGDLT